ncbi:hypothetical protein GCM10022403_090650 [Streptomyces coacervatus]|uniref:Uncharacterized protein n=1 Tax=Streptomyces coacervatus TaxID=647381 RepID=A0ABP7JI32_9ACTN
MGADGADLGTASTSAPDRTRAHLIHPFCGMSERRAAENVRHDALRTLPSRDRSAYTDGRFPPADLASAWEFHGKYMGLRAHTRGNPTTHRFLGAL